MLRRWIWALVAITAMQVVALPRSAAQSPSPNDESRRWMTRAELEKLMLDRTVKGVYPEGTPWRETMHPNGSTDYWESAKHQVGRWWFEPNGMLCFKYDLTGGGGCFRYMVVSANCFEHFSLNDAPATPPEGKPTPQAPPTPPRLASNGRLWREDTRSTCDGVPTA